MLPRVTELADTRPERSDPLAALPRIDRHKPKGGEVRKSRVSKWRAAVLVLVHIAVGIHVLQWLASGRTLSPIEPSEAMTGLETGKINAGFVFFAAALVATLVFGRFVCGWACHVVAWQDASAWLLGKLGIRPRPVRSRLLIYAPFLVGGYMFVWPQFAHWFLDTPPPPGMAQWEVDLLVDDLWRTFPGPVMSVVSILVVGFLIVWWLGAKGFCTHGCPYGAFFAVADRFAPLRIRVTDACEHCGHCTHVCSSNVRVHEEVAKHGMVVDPGCMKCLDCVSVCPKDALYYGAGPVKPFAVSQQRIQARADFTWAEEGFLAAAALFALWAFRGAWFGENVPFLLAVGLAAITAVAMLLLVRLVARRDLTFQHTALKRDGRLTGAGRWSAALLAGFTLLLADTAYTNRAGAVAVEDAFALLREQRSTRAVDPARFQAVADHLAHIDAWAFVTPPTVLAARGLVLRELAGRTPIEQHQGAIRELERMVRRQPFDRVVVPPAYTALATYYVALQRPEAARPLVDEVLRKVPNDATAQALAQQLAAMGR